jgi:5'-methylthioadenosine phosphorylase
MTVMPEAALARELNICYVNIAIVTNQAAGLSKVKLTATEVLETMKKTDESIVTILKEWLPLLPSGRSCKCKDALQDAKIS